MTLKNLLHLCVCALYISVRCSYCCVLLLNLFYLLIFHTAFAQIYVDIYPCGGLVVFAVSVVLFLAQSRLRNAPRTVM